MCLIKKETFGQSTALLFGLLFWGAQTSITAPKIPWIWLCIQIVKSMYDNAHLKVRITNCYSMSINVSLSVHEGSVLSPLLFIIVMEALSHEFRNRCPWELLHTNDLITVVESLDELKMRLKNWKEGLKVKGLKVNIRKTKVMCFRHNASNHKITSIKFPSGICWKTVGADLILCLVSRNGCIKCSGIWKSLRNWKDFICKTYLTVAEADDPFPTCITTQFCEFCYLDDIMSRSFNEYFAWGWLHAKRPFQK